MADGAAVGLLPLVWWLVRDGTTDGSRLDDEAAWPEAAVCAAEWASEAEPLEVDAALGASEASAELLELDDEEEEAGTEDRDGVGTYAPADEAEDITHDTHAEGRASAQGNSTTEGRW